MKVFMSVLIAIAIPAFCFADTHRTSEVAAPNVAPEIQKITYESTFYGYQSAINRDFTVYGRVYGDEKSVETGWKTGPIAMADMNDDGLDDLVRMSANRLSLEILDNLGDGTFAAMRTVSVEQGAQQDLTLYIAALKAGVLSCLQPEDCQTFVADFDGDGLADIGSYSPESGVVTLRYGCCKEPFERTAQWTWPVAKAGGQMTAGDMNADGRGDLVLYGGSTTPDGFETRFGNGDDTLASRL